MMDLTWQQIQAMSTFIMNPRVKKVRLRYGWTTKTRGYKTLFATVYTEGHPQMVYQLQKKRVAPKRWRKPVEWVGDEHEFKLKREKPGNPGPSALHQKVY